MTQETKAVAPQGTPEYKAEDLRRLLLQDFQRRLNAEPNPDEFDKTPDGKARTLPISFVEMTLDELYLGLWETEKFTWSAITNEVQGSIELVVTHPVTGEKMRRTGAASIVITVDSLSDEEKKMMTKQQKNLHALSPENKKSNALDLGFPKLKAECTKNAAQSLGKIFGRDINRKKTDQFKPPLKPIPDDALLAAIKRVEGGRLETIALAEASFILTEEQRAMIYGAIPEHPKQLN